jgi:hypothetical protein
MNRCPFLKDQTSQQLPDETAQTNLGTLLDRCTKKVGTSLNKNVTDNMIYCSVKNGLRKVDYCLTIVRGNLVDWWVEVVLGEAVIVSGDLQLVLAIAVIE